ncbi:hypothetical protein C8F04DRAFT_991258 [Mycena alexandri]|uniref:F-box domain-containing protein n=1 Tax=Mycena alexandri TaxID=1745969 RepID=A0AAD6TE91_9AGAR|nr:hypothetical protein C8F04DRAFT_991258 [Mycena alexandri]
MGRDNAAFEAKLTEDLAHRALMILTANPGMSQEAAMLQAETDLRDLALKNNPFRPPTGCPVNDLPPELLAHIFKVGCEMQAEEGDADYEDEDGLDLEDEWETDEEDGEADEVVEDDEDKDVRMGSPEKRRTQPASHGAAPPETDGEESESEDGDDWDADLPFQVLVSHVCKHWRAVALNSHTLWQVLQFTTHLNVEKSKAWLERSNGLPLDIFIDCTSVHGPHEDGHDHEGEDEAAHHPPTDQQAPSTGGGFMGIIMAFNPTTGTLTTDTITADGTPLANGELQPTTPPEPCISLDDFKVILDMIMPHVHNWRVLEVSANFYTYMYELLSRLAKCPAAPLLEELGLYNYEESESEEVETFEPAHLAEAFLPFQGNAPKVTHVAFWGVHIAWEAALPMLQGLREIELAYHTRDVRPSFETFRAMLDASPEIELLSLCFSGPVGDMEVLEVPSLRTLVLCYLEPDFVKPLLGALVLPGLEELNLDLVEEDFTDFATQLAEPARGQTRSLLAGLTTMKLTGLQCNDATCAVVMAQLEGLKRLHINCEGEEERFFTLLSQLKGSAPQYCPKLESLRVEGVEGSELRKLVATRKTAGAPLQQVFIGNRDFVDPKDERWLRANVETLDFFDPSDDSEPESDVLEVMDTDSDLD